MVAKPLPVDHAWKAKHPPMLNTAPDGFVPGRFTSSFLLCPANLDYYFADLIVPYFYRLGFCANDITTLNCLQRALSIYLFYVHDLFFVVFLQLIIHQILDAADGQMARRYKFNSAWGAIYDHVSDSIYGCAFFAAVLFKIYGFHGWASLRFGVFVIAGLIIFIGGNSSVLAKERKGYLWKDFNLLERYGCVQEWCMDYVYGLLIIYGVSSGAFSPNTL